MSEREFFSWTTKFGFAGQLRVLLEHHNDGMIQTDPFVPFAVRQLQNLQELAQNISDAGVLVVKKSEPSYFKSKSTYR